MSGHSKWKNIMHKKEKTDAQRAKIFTKIGKEMSIAIREGGADPASNGKLRELIAKAKANNVPNDNIERILKKFSGDNSIVYDEITYEGYGPGGVALIVTTATDNKNRTGPEIRHYFDKFGGNLGTNGCVSYLFSDQGVILIAEEDVPDEDKLMETALEAGASDVEYQEGSFQITTEFGDLYTVRDALEAAGYKIASADHDKVPSVFVTLEKEDDIKNMQTLLEMLEDNDDVQDVFHNWENCDEE
ncbi:MAG: YebC/PmpR family DNA-binding transcriptional regulator [Clostridia bacterium]|nr:YebC/PmpR family DNA-binding transcriptional regulator [Clostridia bacterium]